MSKVLFGPIITDARNKFAGLVFQKSFYGALIKKKTSPGATTTPASRSAKAVFSATAKSWAATLTQDQRNRWSALATANPTTERLRQPSNTLRHCLLHPRQRLHKVTLRRPRPRNPLHRTPPAPGRTQRPSPRRPRHPHRLTHHHTVLLTHRHNHQRRWPQRPGRHMRIKARQPRAQSSQSKVTRHPRRLQTRRVRTIRHHRRIHRQARHSPRRLRHRPSDLHHPPLQRCRKPQIHLPSPLPRMNPSTAKQRATITPCSPSPRPA